MISEWGFGRMPGHGQFYVYYPRTAIDPSQGKTAELCGKNHKIFPDRAGGVICWKGSAIRVMNSQTFSDGGRMNKK